MYQRVSTTITCHNETKDHRSRVYLLVPLLIVAAASLYGVMTSHAQVVGNDNLLSQQASGELDKTYQSYLTGTPVEARADLLKAEKHIVNLKIHQEATRFLLFARLHCLAKALGNDGEAAIHFVRARYWYLMSLEVADPNCSVEQLSEKLKAMTEEQCDRFVIEFDKANAKKEARYWKLLPRGPASPDQWLRSQYKGKD
jgi:hypothetical protein